MSRRIVVTILRNGQIKDTLFDAQFVLDVLHFHEYTSKDESLGRMMEVFIFDEEEVEDINKNFPETAKSLDEIVKDFIYGLMEYYDLLKIEKEFDGELIKYSIVVD